MKVQVNNIRFVSSAGNTLDLSTKKLLIVPVPKDASRILEELYLPATAERKLINDLIRSHLTYGSYSAVYDTKAVDDRTITLVKDHNHIDMIANPWMFERHQIETEPAVFEIWTDATFVADVSQNLIDQFGKVDIAEFVAIMGQLPIHFNRVA